MSSAPERTFPKKGLIEGEVRVTLAMFIEVHDRKVSKISAFLSDIERDDRAAEH